MTHSKQPLYWNVPAVLLIVAVEVGDGGGGAEVVVAAVLEERRIQLQSTKSCLSISLAKDVNTSCATTYLRRISSTWHVARTVIDWCSRGFDHVVTVYMRIGQKNTNQVEDDISYSIPNSE